MDCIFEAFVESITRILRERFRKTVFQTSIERHKEFPNESYYRIAEKCFKVAATNSNPSIYGKLFENENMQDANRLFQMFNEYLSRKFVYLYPTAVTVFEIYQDAIKTFYERSYMVVKNHPKRDSESKIPVTPEEVFDIVCRNVSVRDVIRTRVYSFNILEIRSKPDLLTDIKALVKDLVIPVKPDLVPPQQEYVIAPSVVVGGEGEHVHHVTESSDEESESASESDEESSEESSDEESNVPSVSSRLAARAPQTATVSPAPKPGAKRVIVPGPARRR